MSQSTQQLVDTIKEALRCSHKEAVRQALQFLNEQK